jgi:hypothetical protein
VGSSKSQTNLTIGSAQNCLNQLAIASNDSLVLLLQVTKLELRCTNYKEVEARFITLKCSLRLSYFLLTIKPKMVDYMLCNIPTNISVQLRRLTKLDPQTL